MNAAEQHITLFSITPLAPLPDPHGFAGMFAGVAGGALIRAGGANFPAEPLAQGGRKVWHDRVFTLAKPDTAWRLVARMPRPSGYGVSATWRDCAVFVGGGDERENFRHGLQSLP